MNIIYPAGKFWIAPNGWGYFDELKIGGGSL